MKVSKDNRQESDGGKVRHSSATDGDRVAAWVEPSEGVCVCVEHLAAMTTPSGQVGEVSVAPAVARRAARVQLRHAT